MQEAVCSLHMQACSQELRRACAAIGRDAGAREPGGGGRPPASTAWHSTAQCAALWQDHSMDVTAMPLTERCVPSRTFPLLL